MICTIIGATAWGFVCRDSFSEGTRTFAAIAGAIIIAAFCGIVGAP